MKTHRSSLLAFVGVLGAMVLSAACGSDTATTEDPPGNTGGTAGGGGKAGSAGSAGKAGGASGSSGQAAGGQAGTSAGGAGAGGATGGQSGAAGASAGSAGTTTGGTAGASAGSAGASAGSAGAGAGAGGTDAGAGGSDAGAGGTEAGAAGSDAGQSGAAGSETAGGAGGGSSGTGGSAGEPPCVAQNAEATLVKKPVDIIFVIDNSGSMGGEIAAVKNNINVNFAKIIGDSGLDYRVIMLSRYGNSSSLDVCVSKPLGGNECKSSESKPINTSTFFHYSQVIGSHDSWAQILATYPKKDGFGLAPTGWREWLRDDSLKVFVEITDDDPTGTYNTAAKFDDALLALTPKKFGTKEKRNYVFHSIIGLKANSGGKPWLPTDPVQNSTCGSGSESAAPEYQKLSILTGGLRFPICNNASFDVVFKSIAQGVVEGSKIECSFPIPPAPPGETIDPSTIVVNYTPSGGGADVSYEQIPSAAGCNGNSFYIDQNSTIVLCPSVCEAVQADNKAKIGITYGCGKV